MFTISLVVDGSPEILDAARIAIALSKELGNGLKAYAFVDQNSILDATGFSGNAGLCGSGIYLQGCERIVEIVCDICRALMQSLEARAAGCGVMLDDEIQLARPAQFFAEKASADNVIVLGMSLFNVKLAEELALNTSCQVVIVERCGDETVIHVLSTPSIRTTELEKLLPLIPHTRVSPVTSAAERSNILDRLSGIEDVA